MAKNRLPKNEFGFTLCRTPRGKLVRGKVHHGTPSQVVIPVTCPPASKLEGLFHTHPGGVAFPSEPDIRNAFQAKIKVLCVMNESALNCFRLIRRS